jgi:hypothetical protein
MSTNTISAPPIRILIDRMREPLLQEVQGQRKIKFCPYILQKNSLLERNLMAEPGIEHRTSCSAGLQLSYTCVKQRDLNPLFRITNNNI